MSKGVRGVLFVMAVLALYSVTACGSGALNEPEVTTVAGTGVVGDEDGSGDQATFNNPDGVTVARDRGGEGNDTLYITDLGNNEVRQIGPDGEVTTVAGTGEAGYVDGPADTAQFDNPDGIVTDTSGNIYVADSGNNVIRKITPEGEVSTLAGTGEAGNADGDAGEAQFDTPTGITMDSSDNLLVTDEGNNTVRKITPAGEVSTIAGTGEAGFADGVVAEAQFDAPHGIAIDDQDNIYVTDVGNSRVRKIDAASGDVTTIAGNGVNGYADGVAQISQIDSPHGIDVGLNGVVYFADEENNRVRIVANGVVTTLAGEGEGEFADGSAKKAKFNQPRGLALGWDKNAVYICDYSNQRIRKIEQ